MKSAESDRKEHHESCPEMDDVAYMPGGYKISMGATCSATSHSLDEKAAWPKASGYERVIRRVE